MATVYRQAKEQRNHVVAQKQQQHPEQQYPEVHSTERRPPKACLVECTSVDDGIHPRPCKRRRISNDPATDNTTKTVNEPLRASSTKGRREEWFPA